LFDEKVNLVGALRGQNLEFSIVFKSTGKSQTKIKKKRQFLSKIDFGFWYNFKTNNCKYLKFAAYVYFINLYI